MVRLLDKKTEIGLLEDLFGILYENMRAVTPFDRCFEEERSAWVTTVGSALQKEPRKILLLFSQQELIGFCMFYVNGGIFMVEELQIRREFQRSAAFAECYRYFPGQLPRDVAFIEAYADRRNISSQALMRKAGMEPVGETPDGSCIHFRGNAGRIFK